MESMMIGVYCDGNDDLDPDEQINKWPQKFPRSPRETNTIVPSLQKDDLEYHLRSAREHCHHSCIPVTKLNIESLPVEFQEDNILNLIKLYSYLTVGITVKRTDEDGNSFTVSGCGKIHSVELPEFLRHIPTFEIKRCGTKSIVRGFITILTSSHLVRDTLDAQNSSSTLYVDNITGPVTINEAVLLRADYTKDVCLLCCEVYDEILLIAMYMIIKETEDYSKFTIRDIMHKAFVENKSKLSLVISYPIGSSKYIHIQRSDRESLNIFNQHIELNDEMCPSITGATVLSFDGIKLNINLLNWDSLNGKFIVTPMENERTLTTKDSTDLRSCMFEKPKIDNNTLTKFSGTHISTLRCCLMNVIIMNSNIKDKAKRRDFKQISVKGEDDFIPKTFPKHKIKRESADPQCIQFNTETLRDMDILEKSGAEIIRLNFVDFDCPVNTDHKLYIPHSKFSKFDLPKTYQHEEMGNLVKSLADLTVLIEVLKEDDSETTTQEKPLYWQGTGKVDEVFIPKIRKHVCQCVQCRNSENPSQEWGEVRIVTNVYLLQGNKNADKYKCTLFYNDIETPSSELKYLHGDRNLKYGNSKEVGKFMCVTCDMELLNKLDKMVDTFVGSWKAAVKKYSLTVKSEEDKLVVLVSHPHGCCKQISIGKWFKEIRNADEKIKMMATEGRKIYITPTCPGSSGAFVLIPDFDVVEDIYE